MLFRTHQSKPSSARARFSRLALESLEDRTVLSTTASLPVNNVSVVPSSYSSSDILIEFRKGDQPRAALAGTSIGAPVDLGSNLYEVNLSSGVTVPKALAAYRTRADVLFAEPDFTLESTAIPSNSSTVQQWALQAINAQQAWNVTQGSPNIIVAVDDTGIDYDNPDLYSNIWINQADIPASRLKNLVDVDNDGFISMADLNNPINQGPGKIEDLNGDGYIDAGDLLQPMILNAQGQDTGLGGWVNPHNVDSADGLVGDLIGWNFNGNNNNPYDNNGHGTHVAGIIAGTGNDGGTLGVAPDVQLMPIQFLDASGNGTVSQFIEGLDYAVAHGAKISNNSWTGADPSQALTAAINNAKAHGMIFVAAAGNSSNNNNARPVYPSSFTENNVVAVAATDSNGNLAGFSNYGATSVDLAAPGVNILSSLPGGSYGDKSGTSMATPYVAGVLALVWSEHPSWNYLQVINQVESTVTPEAGLKGKVATGGIVNAGAAVASVSTSSQSPKVVSASPVVSSTASGPTPYTLSTIQVTFSVGVDPTTFTAADLSLIGPNGKIDITGVAVVSGTGDRTFHLSFAKQTTPGTYTLYVGVIAEGLDGKPIAAYSHSFNLAAAPVPTHVISSTAKGPSAYSLSSIQVTFNRGVSPSTFTASNLGLVGPAGHVAITGVTVVDGSNDCIFNITFATQFKPGTYTLYVGGKTKDLAGNSVEGYSTAFKVVAAPVPTHVVSSSARGPSQYTLSTIQVTFSQGVDPATFGAAAAGLVGPAGHVAVTGVSVVDGSNDCTFNITFATQSTGGTYTLYLGTKPKDLAGNPIGSYSASFKLAAAPTHVVSSSARGPSKYSLSTIQVTFSQGVDPTTFSASSVDLDGPNGSVAITGVAAVSGSGNRTFNVTFGTQSSAGTYSLSIGTDPKDVNGNPIVAYSTSFKLAGAPTHVVSSSESGPSASTLSTIQVTFSKGVAPSTFTASDLDLIGPAGHVAITGVTAVSGSNDCTFKISFATQSKGGTYTLHLGTDPRDLNGNSIEAYSTSFKIAGSTTIPPPTAASFTSSNTVAITRGGTAVSKLAISKNLTIGHITVKVDVQYPQIGDLEIYLQSPDGTQIMLSQWMGGNAANYPNTTFDDNASQSIAFAGGPYTGSYQPLTPLNYLNGKSTQGTWTLWVVNQGTSTGSIVSWSLNVKAS